MGEESCTPLKELTHECGTVLPHKPEGFATRKSVIHAKCGANNDQVRNDDKKKKCYFVTNTTANHRSQCEPKTRRRQMISWVGYV